MTTKTVIDGSIADGSTGTQKTTTGGDKWAQDVKCKINFHPDNPHRKETKLWEKYEKVKRCVTVGWAKELGASAWELKDWKDKG